MMEHLDLNIPDLREPSLYSKQTFGLRSRLPGLSLQLLIR